MGLLLYAAFVAWVILGPGSEPTKIKAGDPAKPGYKADHPKGHLWPVCNPDKECYRSTQHRQSAQ